jgi:hypothetical protein
MSHLNGPNLKFVEALAIRASDECTYPVEPFGLPLVYFIHLLARLLTLLPLTSPTLLLPSSQTGSPLRL